LFEFLVPISETSSTREGSGAGAKDLPYRLRDDFLSPAEFSFYKVFSSIYGTRLTVQSKVRLADVFFVSRPNRNYTFFNRIAQRHLDFLTRVVLDSSDDARNKTVASANPIVGADE
jgi:hypothetical protein